MKTFTLATSKTLFFTVKFDNEHFSFTRHYTPTLPEPETVKAFSGKGGTGGTYSIWQAATKNGVLSDLKAIGAKKAVMIKFSNWMDDQEELHKENKKPVDLKAMFSTMRK